MKRTAALVLLALLSAITYYLLLFRPYALAAHLGTPHLSLPTMTNRRPAAAVEFLLCFMVAFLLYALAYRLGRNWRSRSAVAVILVLGLLLAGLLVLVYPIGATDVFDYIVQGEQLALHNLNPLVVPASAAPDLPHIRWAAYSGAISPYGPLWVGIQGIVVKLAGGGGLIALVVGFKLIAILGYLFACLMILGVLARTAPSLRLPGLIAFAWNPLVLTEVAVNAHNDIWIAALLLAGLLFWKLRLPVWMLAAVMLALLIKPFALPLLPLFALIAWRQAAPGSRVRLVVAAALVVFILAVGPNLLLPEGLKGMTALSKRTELFTHSLPAAAYYLLSNVTAKATAARLVGLATTAVFGAYLLLQLRNAWRRPQDTPRLTFNVLLFLMLLCMPWFQPWYLVTPMALAALYPREDAPFQAALSTACVVASYVIYGFAWFWWPPLVGNFIGVNLATVLTTYALPWAYAVEAWLQGRRGGNAGSRAAA